MSISVPVDASAWMKRRHRVLIWDALKSRDVDPIEDLFQLDDPLGRDGIPEYRRDVGEV